MKNTYSILDRIGNTPLVEIKKLNPYRSRVRIFAKLEGFNPGGSVKDRPASNIIQRAEEKGLLNKNKILLDASSGNTAIAYAMISAVKGYRAELCMPSNVSVERIKILKAYGAKLIETDALKGPDGAIVKANELAQANPDKYFYGNQYNNPANPEAHRLTTSQEILEQTDGQVTHFVAGIGTGGTIMGTGEGLKKANSRIQIFAAEPDAPLHGLEGLKHMASSIVPGIYQESRLDGKIPIPTETAYDTVKQLSQKEGLLVGLSSGGALYAALELAKKLDSGWIVTVFPDGGDRYLSIDVWD
jgi:S-sulfo-L-cysteine synthase (O-acetyl-L-serine-dependent)